MPLSCIFDRAFRRNFACVAIATVSATVFLGCGGAGERAPAPPTGPSPSAPAPGFSIAAGAWSAPSVHQGDSTSAVLTVTRTGGFSGDVALAVDSTPSNLPARIAPTTLRAGESTAQLELLPTMGMAPGSHVVRIRATTESLPSQFITITVVVTRRPVVMTLQRLGGSEQSVIQSGGPSTFSLLATRPAVTGFVRFDVADILPSGVRATFDPDSTLGGITVVSLTADTTALIGTYTTAFRVRSSDDSVTATTPVTFSVLPKATTRFALDQQQIGMVQGGSTTTGMTIFFSPVRPLYELSSRGLPAGATLNFQGSNIGVSDARVTAVFAASTTTLPGSYPVWIIVTERGVPRDSVQLNITVTAAPVGGDITVAFCGDATTQPIWFGHGRAAADWTRLQPNADGRYAFSLPTDVANLMWVNQAGPDDFSISVVLAVRAEFREMTERGCIEATSRAVNATLTGLASGDDVALAVGARSVRTPVSASSIVVPLSQLGNGPLDVLAARWRRGAPDAPFLADRVFIGRAQQFTGTTIGPIDLASAPAPDAISVHVFDASSTESMTVSSAFRTTSGSNLALGLHAKSTAGGAFAARAVPAANRQSGDLHAITVSGTSTVDGQAVTRSATRYTATPGNDSLALGAVGPALSLSVASSNGTWARYTANTVAQPEYLRAFSMELLQSSGALRRRVHYFTTAAGLNLRDRLVNANFRAINPDGASGWNTLWEPRLALPIAWTTSSFGWDTAGGYRAPVADGIVWRSTTRSGTWTPP